MSDEKSLEAPAEDWRPRGAKTTVMSSKSNKGSKERRERSNDTPRGADRYDGYTLQGSSPVVVQKNGTYQLEGSPSAEQPIAGMDFFFDACVRSPCNNELVEDVDTISQEDHVGGTVVDDGKYVTRTFHWRPEDFPLEVATYMQSEEPGESTQTENDRIMAQMRTKAMASRYRAQNAVQDVPGRRCTAQPSRVAADDEPDDMLDDEFSMQEDMEPAVPAACSASAPAESSAGAPQQGRGQTGGDLLDLEETEETEEKGAKWPAAAQADAGAAATPAKALEEALEEYPIFTPQRSLVDLQETDAAERKNREEELAAQVSAQAAEIEQLKQALAMASNKPPPTFDAGL